MFAAAVARISKKNARLIVSQVIVDTEARLPELRGIRRRLAK
jgi:hypothetical protein